MAQLLLPEPGRAAAEMFVRQNLAALTDPEIQGSPSLFGGAKAAQAALASFDVAGFAERFEEVTPHRKRGASGLSPYLRHGLLTTGEVWDRVDGGPAEDVEKFREQLLWHEYARHWYSRVGGLSRQGTHRELADVIGRWGGETIVADMACVEMLEEELVDEGWLVGRSRNWLASYWAAKDGAWRDSEDLFFRHLLDGSRAANRLGWQLSLGLTGGRPFKFSRWNVEKWAAGLCSTCDRVRDCPLEETPPELIYINSDVPLEVNAATDLLESAGPPAVERRSRPEAVWLTGESLGPTDPALLAYPSLPVIFIFDEPLLARLQLSSKRLVFMVETLVEIADTRRLEIWLGPPSVVLADRSVAVTFAPVPGFRTHAASIQPAAVHPWPWFIEPSTGSVSSFREWRRSVGASFPLSRPAA